MTDPFEFVPHAANREDIEQLRLYEASKPARDLFNDIKFFLDDVIDIIERTIRIEVVHSPVKEEEQSELDFDYGETLFPDQVQSQYFRPRIENNCSHIHRNLFEAIFAMKALQSNVANDSITDPDDLRAIDALEDHLHSYKEFYNEKIQPHFYTEARLLTPSLNMLQGTIKNAEQVKTLIPKKSAEYLQDAVREFLGLPHLLWALKNYEYHNSSRVKNILDENLMILCNLAEEYSNEADLIALDLDSPELDSLGNRVNLEHLENFNKQLKLFMPESYKNIGLKKILASETTYQTLRGGLVNKIYRDPKKYEIMPPEKIAQLLKVILILDQLKFKSSMDEGQRYLDSKTNEYRFKNDFRVDSVSMKDFYMIYRDCREYVRKCVEGEPLELRSQSLVDSTEMMNVSLKIENEIEKSGVKFTLNNPDSSFNKFVDSLDDSLKPVLEENKGLLFAIKEGFNIDKVLGVLYENASDPKVSIMDTARLMVVLSLVFSIEE